METLISTPQELTKAKLILIGFESARQFAVTKEEVMPLALEFAKQLHKEITGKEWV